MEAESEHPVFFGPFSGFRVRSLVFAVCVQTERTLQSTRSIHPHGRQMLRVDWSVWRQCCAWIGPCGASAACGLVKSPEVTLCAWRGYKP